MTVPRRARAYLGDAFVVEHAPPTPTARATAVVILPPLGYEDTSAYRPLRVLADALATAGHVVVRLDWPGLGDSAGDAEDDTLVDRQIAAARAAVTSLRERGFPRVAAIGVRAGGLLALAAGGIDEIVLWGTPASGKALLREERAFHRMAAAAFGATPEHAPLPAGAVEAGGFFYSAGSVKALNGLVAAALVPRDLRRALVIAREGTTPAPDLLAALQHAEVTTSAGGLGDLLDDPYRSTLTTAVRDTILGWFAADTATVHPTPATGADTLDLGGVIERPWLQEGGAGQLSGIVCEPAGGAAAGATWTLFLNAGGVRRSGPNRLWTRAARVLAAEGRPSLRLDVRDVGDSDGAAVPHHDLEEMYSESSIGDVVTAWEAVHGLGAGAVDVVGLCSGAFLGVQVAARRDVRRALLINCLAYVWDDDARSNGMTAQIGRSLLDGRRWKRLITGRIDARALARAIVTRGRLEAIELGQRLRGRPATSAVDRLLRDVGAVTRIELVSSEGDPSIEYLARHVPPERRPPLTVLPGVDHTVRPVWAHPKMIDLIRG